MAAASRDIQRRNGKQPANKFVFTRLLPLQTLFTETVSACRDAVKAAAVRPASTAASALVRA